MTRAPTIFAAKASPWLVALFLATPIALSKAPPSLSLSQAYQRTLSQSDDLESLRAAMTRARAGRRRALAALLPSLSAGGSYQVNDQEVSLGSSSVVRQHQLNGSLSLDLGLFDGRAFPAYRSGSQRVEVAQLRLEDGQQLLLLEVGRAYYTALAAEAMIEVSVRAVAARKRHLQAARARLKAGHAVRLDVERATAALHQAEREAIDAAAQAEATRDGLALAMGQDPPLVATLSAAAEPVAPAPTPALLERALGRREGLRALLGELEVAERGRFATWMSFLPQVSAVGRLALSQESFSNPDGVAMTLTVNLAWSLYDGGARYAQLEDDQGAIRQARAALSKAKREVRGQVRAALRSLRRARAALRASEAQRKASQRALKAAEAAFQLAAATGLDVLDAQLALEQASAGHIREQLEQRIAHLELKRALGQTLQGSNRNE